MYDRNTPLALRCLALTGTIETSKQPPGCFSKVTGNFDGQGISLGALQWNIGQKSLQPLLQKMIYEHPADSTYFEALKHMLSLHLPEQLEWAMSIQMNNRVNQDWVTFFDNLGKTPEFQQIQVDAAKKKFDVALSWMPTYKVNSERAVALLFDIATQNGSIKDATRDLILSLYKEGMTEQDKLLVIANKRAEASNPRWIEDVRSRKCMIATGSGIVHGMQFELVTQFGISLRDAVV